MHPIGNNREFKTYTDQYFGFVEDLNEVPAVIERKRFERCTFDEVQIPPVADPRSRRILRDLHFENCRFLDDIRINSALLDNVLIDGFRIKGGIDPQLTAGAVYRHVRFTGLFDPIMLSGDVDEELAIEFEEEVIPRQADFDAAKEEFYNSIDWALDVSQAIFTGETILHGVPGHLVVRDPSSQILITRETAETFDLDKIDFGETGWNVAIAQFLNGVDESEVFVAPTKGSDAEDALAVVKRLKEIGLAAPDHIGMCATSPRR